MYSKSRTSAIVILELTWNAPIFICEIQSVEYLRLDLSHSRSRYTVETKTPYDMSLA